MSSGELLLELLSEEIPARMQRRAIDDLAGLVRDKLAAADIPAKRVDGYVTPRRLTVIAEGIPQRQPDRSEERRGPRVGAPPQALDGFMRTAGLSSIDQCEVRDTGRGEFYFAVVQRPGRASAEVLPELLRDAIGDMPWPKSMRFPAASFHWVRPLDSVLCLFDGAVLPLDLDRVPVGRTTRGHRFLSPAEIAVEDAADYRAKLKAAHVVLDHAERRALIDAELDKQAKAEGLSIKADPGLLDEVAGLVEYPVVLMGRIDDQFVRPLPEGLPPEVLATAMRTHQKYFTCLKPDGSPAPRFLFVANNRTPDGGETIVAGNERVLRARLADARFFWDQDRKVRLEDRLPALKERVYYEKLGTMLDKAERMEKLARDVATFVPGSDCDLAARAALLTKGDLSSGVVGEFPELQGIMGRYYAINDSENPRVAHAIEEHYKPRGPSESCPNQPDSIAVALADKIDTLVAFFSINIEPTGSRDPFGIRRTAIGLIRIIIENQLRIDLKKIIFLSAQVLYQSFRISVDDDQYDSIVDERFGRIPDLYAEVMVFIVDRLKVHLRDRGVRHDLIEAVFQQVGIAENDLVRLLARVDALAKFLGTGDGSNLLIAYRRATNIVTIEERRNSRSYTGDIDRELLKQREEDALELNLFKCSLLVDEALAGERFDDAMAALATLRQPVDEFFDKVTVNTEDRTLRENRLRLLSRIRAVMNQVADFSQIEG